MSLLGGHDHLLISEAIEAIGTDEKATNYLWVETPKQHPER